MGSRGEGSVVGRNGSWMEGCMALNRSLGKAKTTLDACRSRDADALRAALAGAQGAADLERRDANGWTAIGAACEVDFPEGVELLIEAGANVQASNAMGCSPLAVACSMGSEKCVVLLIDAGADVDAGDSTGFTPLMRRPGVGARLAWLRCSGPG